MKQKFFFFDVDNTLISWPQGEPVGRTLATLRALRKKGHLVSLATGRLQQDAISYGKEMGIDHVVADGGHSVTVNGEILRMEPMDVRMCRHLLQQLEVANIPWAVTLENKMERWTKHEFVANRVEPWDHFKTRHDANLDYMAIDSFFKIFIYMTEEEESKHTIDYGNLEHLRYGEDSILIEPMDKSQGIRYLAGYYGIPLEDVVTFGDGNNDLRMFEPIWTNIAMGNAREELKQKATYITDDSDKDGIYKACIHFGWLQEEDVEEIEKGI